MDTTSLQILSVTLFEKTPILQALQPSDSHENSLDDPNQLILFDFYPDSSDIWAYWKQHGLPNVCPKHYWELDERSRKSLRRMRRKPRLITVFWKQSSLCLD